jgi:hypothetical protein
MTFSHDMKLTRAVRRATRGVAAAGVLALSVGCSTDKILRVTDPDVAPSSFLNSPAALPALRNGALAAFHATYIGTGDVNESSGQIGYSGLLSDELRSSDTYPTRNQVDQRAIQLDNGSNEDQFILLSKARAAADLAATQYEKFAPDSSGLALAYALGGYTTVLFGENYCSGVPFSTLGADGVPQYGDPLTTKQIFQRAVAKFDAALAAPGVTGQYRNLALVGKARALLDLDSLAAAKATAQQVAADYEFEIGSSETTTTEYNGFWEFNYDVGRLTLANREGTNGLDYLTANDPRVTWENTGIAGFDGTTLLLLQGKYGSRDATSILASTTEAQLIVAEVDLAANDSVAALATLNSLRTAQGMTALTMASGHGAQVTQLFRERAFWLYLTSHRLGDMRRLIRQYSRQTESVFPTGGFFKAGFYGTDVNFPVPDVELNNPKFHGCIDRNA